MGVNICYSFAELERPTPWSGWHIVVFARHASDCLVVFLPLLFPFFTSIKGPFLLPGVVKYCYEKERNHSSNTCMTNNVLAFKQTHRSLLYIAANTCIQVTMLPHESIKSTLIGYTEGWKVMWGCELWLQWQPFLLFLALILYYWTQNWDMFIENRQMFVVFLMTMVSHIWSCMNVQSFWLGLNETRFWRVRQIGQ